MFDVSFFELLVIGVVALVVIGPERLPGAVKTAVLWFARLKRALLETRSEIEKHIGADEIRRELHNEQVLASLEKLKASREALERDLADYQHKIEGELLEHEPLPNPQHTSTAAVDHPSSLNDGSTPPNPLGAATTEPSLAPKH
jgi:sec-independent protein translocase protein TatB